MQPIVLVALIVAVSVFLIWVALARTFVDRRVAATVDRESNDDIQLMPVSEDGSYIPAPGDQPRPRGVTSDWDRHAPEHVRQDVTAHLMTALDTTAEARAWRVGSGIPDWPTKRLPQRPPKGQLGIVRTETRSDYGDSALPN